MAKPYSAKEEDAMRRLFPTASRAEILAAIPARTWHEIHMAAVRRQITRPRRPHNSVWEGAPAEALLARYEQEGAQKIAAEFGFKPHAVSSKAKAMGLRYRPVSMPHKRQVERGARAEAKRLARWEASELARQQARQAKRKPRAPRPAPKPVAKAPEPVKRSPATPILNARVEQRRLAEQRREQAPKPFVTADQLKAAPQPVRWAYTCAANRGPQAATEAFYAAMQQLKPAA